MFNLRLDQRQLCDVQGRLFELALKKEYDSTAFIAAFMNSHVAVLLDDVYDHMQWAGEEYILEALNDEVGGLQKSSHHYPREVMYWTGYLYRYWHYYTKETSKEIYQIANAEKMRNCWLGFHTMDAEMAIEDLKEIYLFEQSSNGQPFQDRE